MILLEKTEVVGFEPAIRGMRNPKNSWAKSDSGICKGGDNGIGCQNCASYDCCHSFDHSFQIGKNDYELMMKLVKGGPVHAKFRRMIAVYVDITAPLYWWKEFDTYKVGTVANSCSTMHKIHAKEFTLDDFSHEHLISDWIKDNNDSFLYLDSDTQEPIAEEGIKLQDYDIYSPSDVMSLVIMALNVNREAFLKTGDKRYWWQMIQLLPSSYNQKRTVMLNYEVLSGIYPMRKNHKLNEWHEFCHWIERLPYSDIITGRLPIIPFEPNTKAFVKGPYLGKEESNE